MTRHHTRVGDDRGQVQSVDDAFRCSECGEDLILKAYGNLTLYCSDRDCPHEVGETRMTVEQRFYAKVLRERGNERRPSTEMRETIQRLAEQ